MENDLDLNSYFERIYYTGGREVDENTLREIHIAHTLNVPFENLDVFYGRRILLDEASLCGKIVQKRRGGYCFEMNGVFSLVLRKMGYKVTNLLAKVAMDETTYTTKTHQAILVEAGGKRWLADVGFGNDGLIAPMELTENVEQKQFSHTYRLVSDPKMGYVLQKKAGDKYNSLYAFTLDECSPMDFEMSNHYTSTFPNSFFLTMRMCTMPTREGRVTLTDRHYKVVNNGDTHEEPVADDDAFNEILKRRFKLDLDLIK